ncbi:UvrD-helicase domain-containing protein [archaeon]|nr:UvrD-helicase domain-containing protein [archaeon]
MERDELEYLEILKGLMELPFQVGKNLLIDFLSGNLKNKSVIKNQLDVLNGFGSLNWDSGRISNEIDKLIVSGMIEMVQSDYNRFVKVLGLSIKGRNEITNPTLPDKKLAKRAEFKETEISDEDRALFEEHGQFLKRFNDEQKKAIVSGAPNVLCVAGAGSGKTTILTKRIEFLVKCKGVDPSKILAITFTRKARKQMEERLAKLGVSGVLVNTFNSFCEKILRRHEAQIYGRPIRVQSYGDKILAMNMALASLGMDMQDVVNSYFNLSQKKFMTGSQMANSFMNDCFSVMNYFKVTGSEHDFSKDVDIRDRKNAERIFRIVKFLREHMEVQGLRDYSDQIIDAIGFLKKNAGAIPQFEHVLVDEYQDVNAMQIELLDLLAAPNLFVVGDPRQSIFGWRGSDIKYILDFEKGRDNVEVVHMTKNYRSAQEIVGFMNHAISDMGLPDLEHQQFKVGKDERIVRILDFENEEAERAFVIRNIVDGDVPNNKIFVLARTNRQLNELSRLMKTAGIPHFVREDDRGQVMKEGEEAVTLATVHAIKGLEAKKVFVIGANEQNFPCKASDHPAIEMLKTEDYDREEEERRLFYVAISRAKKILYVTYSGKKPSYYINDEMRALANPGESGGNKTLEKAVVDDGVVGELKSWRAAVSGERGVSSFMILTNATIDEIARVMPKDADELAKVKGIGPAKLVEHGGKILDIVNGVWD